MGFDQAVFAAHLADPRMADVIAERIALLETFYAPFATRELHAATGRAPDLPLVYGTIRFDGSDVAAPSTIVWGSPLPEGLREPGALAAASDQTLRGLAGVFAAVEVVPGHARVVAAATGLTTLYAAQSAEVSAWSSHAAAAALLAFGAGQVDWGAVPELIAAEFVGGARTMVLGVRAVPSATVIDITPAGCSSRSFWPAAERWQAVPEAQASRLASNALLEATARRLEGKRHPWCGLTAGLDSRVVAMCLDELGASFASFTWGEPGWPDPESARALAATLGVPHRTERPEWIPDDGAVESIERAARWHEGILPAAIADQRWPPELDTCFTGGAGEVGRAFYYRLAARNHRRASRKALVGAMALGPRVAGAGDAARRSVESAVAAWIADAEETGAKGWRVLDVVYAEQRVRRWGRARVPAISADYAPAFAHPEVSRALSSLPLADKLGDGFHRDFLLARLPAELVPPAGRAQRAFVPRPARRAAARLRALRRRRRPPAWGLSPMLAERPALCDWIASDVLGHPSLAEQLGPLWVAETRRRFLAHEGPATEAALFATGPVALDAAFRALR